MKKTSLFTLLLFLPSLVLAQPVEEEIINDTPVYEIEVIESPSQIQSSDRISPVAPLGEINPTGSSTRVEPIGEDMIPKPVDEVTESDGAGNLWKFSPAIAVVPIGYNGYEKGTYGEISPSFGLGTTLNTAGGNKINFDLSYAFIWDEYYDKTLPTDRYFEHDSSLGMGMDFNEQWGGALNLGFNYSVRANSGDREFTIISNNALTFNYKPTSDVSLTLGYGLELFNFPDGAVYDSTIGIPSDIEDVRQGDLTYDDSDPFNSFDTGDDIIQPNTWFMNNKALLGVNYKIPTGTTLDVSYAWVFDTFNNSSDLDWNGHWITLKVSQKAWEGGRVSVKNQLRLRNFQATTIDSGSLKRDQRNRTDFAISHAVNDNIGITAFYRLQLVSNNATSKWTPAHSAFLQTSYSF